MNRASARRSGYFFSRTLFHRGKLSSGSSHTYVNIHRFPGPPKQSSIPTPSAYPSPQFPPQNAIKFLSKSNLSDPRSFLLAFSQICEKSADFSQRSHLSPFSTSPIRFMGNDAPQEPSAGAAPAEPAAPIHVVSTFASPFDAAPNHIDAGSSVRKPLSLWPGMYHSPVTNALWEARSSIFERLLDPDKDGPPQTELLTRTPAQSRTSIVYNFSSDYILREQYRDPWYKVRIEKLLEDLDALAGTIAVKVPF